MNRYQQHNRFSLGLPYHDQASNIILGVLLTFLPLWLVWIPYRIMQSPNVQHLLIAPLDFEPPGEFLAQPIWYPDFILKTVGLAITFLCLAALVVFLERKLTINERGIKFPGAYLWRLRGRLRRNWNELSEVKVICSRMLHCKPSKITLVFQDGQEAQLDFDSMSRNQWQKLFIAIQTYAADAKMDAHVQEVHADFVGNDIVLHPFTYARVWRDELSRRFNPTVFVPRETGHALQDGRYIIEGQLAFGGLSAIYLARQRDDQRVVLKEAVLPADADEATTAKARELFQREALLLQQIDHPGVAHVYDSFVENGRSYMVLEYIPGKDLRQLVGNCGAQQIDTVRLWAEEIAQIMNHLHRMDPPIIHRDLTPDNLVLRNDGTLTLIDFGAANHFLGTATGTMVGKQSYMAPEQLRGKATLSSDVYSFGATLYFLLTGQDPEPISQSHVRAQQPLVPVDLDELIAACTHADESRRPASFSEILAMLANKQTLSFVGDDEVPRGRIKRTDTKLVLER